MKAASIRPSSIKGRFTFPPCFSPILKCPGKIMGVSVCESIVAIRWCNSFAWRKMRASSIKWLKSAWASSSPWIAIASGCHWTLKMDFSGWRMPSLIPSVATAVCTNSGARSFTAWWWNELTAMTQPSSSRTVCDASSRAIFWLWRMGGCSACV